MCKNRFPMNLQFFSEEVDSEPTGVESQEISAAEESTEVPETNEPGVEPSDAADPKPNNFEKAFAKRLSAEREKWEADRAKEQERYRDYDKYEKATQYLMKQGNFQDVQQLNDALEQQMLMERAEQMGITPEIAQRLEQLEQKAQLADQLEQQRDQEQQYQSFRKDLESFASDKGVNADDLHNFMFENQIGNKEVAYKAMKADQFEQQLQNAEKEAVKKYLESKKAPKVESTGTAGTVHTEPAKSWEEARSRALERFKALKNNE